jgi:hypothetical protein
VIDPELEPQAWLDVHAPIMLLAQSKVLPGGERYAGLVHLIFTTAVVTGEIGDSHQFLDRWCYNGYAAAKAALDAWEGVGEPSGWHRHPSSGRRISQTGFEIDDNGKQVEGVGVMYVRR